MTTIGNIQFLDVRNAQEKLTRICSVVQEHYLKKERVLIRVPNLEAAHFVDDLLWKMPPESFLPHRITDHDSNEAVIITMLDRNLNKANILVHLCPEPSHIAPAFDWVYDLMDGTHPDRLARSQARMLAYEKARSAS